MRCHIKFFRLFIYFISIFAACLVALAVPVQKSPDFAAEKVWNVAEKVIDVEHVGQLRRYRRQVDEYENFGSFGAIMEFADGVDKKVEFTCTACKAAAESARYFLSEGYSEGELLGLLHSICMDLEIMPQSVCDGFVKNVGPEIVVVLNTTTLAPLQICAFLMGDQCGEVDNPHNDWTVPLPPILKPPPMDDVAPPEDAPKLKVLHLSDTHIDLKYEAGTPSVCNEPLCCRATSTAKNGSEDQLAGKWGDWKCDTPMITFDNLLQHASQTHQDLDYIIWTGDLPSHDLWDQTQETTLDILRTTADKIRQAFPGVPVYPALGNHDSAPANSFPQPEVGGKWNISWLYDELETIWGADYLSGADETQSIRYGAFYSTLARPGLRIISLNMNYCYLANWWLIVNSTDPAQELAWLTEQLQKAEYAGEKVHILGHIPPGHSDCLPTWSHIYAQLITRYEDTVVAQFFGHTHKDEFEVYYDVGNTTRPVSISYVGPSVTTYTDLNPGYRVYQVDGDREFSTRIVVDHETWIFNIEDANASGEPEWRKSYSMREEFGMKSLLPSDWDDLYRRMIKDSETFNLFYTHYKKESTARDDCGSSCKHDRLCAIRSCMLYGDEL